MKEEIRVNKHMVDFFEKTWSLTKIKTFEGRQGIGLSCKINYNGTPVIDFFDSADGGYPKFDYKTKAMKEVFLGNTKQWGAFHNNNFEPETTFINKLLEIAWGI
jgi:hypothetical protein